MNDSKEGLLSEPAWSLMTSIKDYVWDASRWADFSWTLIKIILVIAIGRIIMKVAQRMLNHMMIERERSPLKFDQRRTKTIGKLLNNIVTYTVNFIVILMVLSQMHINLAPVLAGAGVIGLAIGFGAQSLVKDVITGFFIIFEDQFGVGDVIQTGTFKGTVEEIGLRVTRVRSWTGEVHIIPNGSIQQVTNFSVYNSTAVVDLPIAYEEDVERTIEVLKRTIEESYTEWDNVTKMPEVLGIQTLGASDVVIRVTAECKPNTHAGVERELKKRFKTALEENQIEIPYPKMVSIVKNTKAE
ncbi:mechanosensitive ion channel family protein [Gorillibacterium sp. sgz5001074]|uniref:mechanosensitive ion channel family protein n=1 Tax=Gorillibacterium sp. sgz5001074 TaxID=3446695 RepID=UPI003F669194